MIIIKIGGGADIQYDVLAQDLAQLTTPYIIVHGANEHLTALSTQLGNPPQTITSPSGFTSRRTTAKTMDEFLMAYCGYANKRLVQALLAHNIQAVGISGIDGGLARAKRHKIIRSVEDGKTKIIRDDYSGALTHVETELVSLLLDNGFVPVLTPPALSEEHEALNVDGDLLAAQLAQALKAKTLVYLSNVPGLLRDINDPESLITNITPQQAHTYAQGRMKKKVLGALTAQQAGVETIIFSDARQDSPVTKALRGAGTRIQ